MNNESFTDFNTETSSEMFVSVMAILHERLPCAQFYFRQRRKFKARFLEKLGSDERKSLHKESRKLSEYAPEEDKAYQNFSPVRALASPKVLTGWSPSRQANYGARLDGMSTGSSPDIRIRKSVGSRESVGARGSS
jgi:hypothetical protein